MIKRLFKLDDNTILYNTGCLYTDHGQIIGVRKGPEHLICYDYSRQIPFKVPFECWADDDKSTAKNVHERYVHSTYEYCSFEQEFARIIKEHLFEMSVLTDDIVNHLATWADTLVPPHCMSLSDRETTRKQVVKRLNEGWKVVQILELLKWTEEVNPNVEEDVALKNMNDILGAK